MPVRCPVDARKFRAGVNMAPAAIRAWAKDPRAKEASFEATRRRLPALAALRAKSPDRWTAADCKFARRVNSFNARMQGMVDKWGCKQRLLRALRNWGRESPGCSLEAIRAGKGRVHSVRGGKVRRPRGR